jgi:hypothetical protein
MPSIVPVNFSVEDAHAAAGLPEDTELPVAPTVDELDNWTQESYSLDVSAATTLGFPVGNLSETYKRQALMFGSSRWKDVAKGGHSYRFGVALRAIIVVSDIKGGGSLTLPVVSAKVEIEGARATAQLLVRGYKGKGLAEKLPAWQSFGVDSYAEYMKCVSEIQTLIMEDETNISPELLGTTVVSSGPHQMPTAAASVGMVYALHAIAEGSTLVHALDKLGTEESDVAEMLRAAYQSILGEGEKLVPDQGQKLAAKDQLYGLHLKDHWFGG